MIPHSRALRLTLILSVTALGSIAVPVIASGSPVRSFAQTPPPTAEPTDPRTRIGRANAAARVQPERTSYFNAIQQYAYLSEPPRHRSSGLASDGAGARDPLRRHRIERRETAPGNPRRCA